MTLRELIESLSTIEETFGGELDIVLAKDSEGNSYSILSSVEDGIYDEQDRHFFPRYTIGDNEYFQPVGENKAVCLWPRN